ncbi:MAG: ABC transporter permease [Sumerlaeia bacterium]
MRSVFVVAHHEIRLLARDVKALLLLFVLPIALIVIAIFALGSLYGGGMTETRVLLVDEDGSALSRQIAVDLGTYPQLLIETSDPFLNDSATTQPMTRERAQAILDSGDRFAAIVIPGGFGEAVTTGAAARIQILRNPAQTAGPAIAFGILQGIATRLSADVIARGVTSAQLQPAGAAPAPPGQAERMLADVQRATAEAWENPPVVVEQTDVVEVTNGEIDPLKQNVPGYAVMFSLFTALLCGESLLRDRDTGAYRRLLCAPLSKGALLLGKLLAAFCVAVIQLIVFFSFGHFVFGMELGNSAAALVLMCAVLALTTTSLGIFLAAVVKTQNQLFSLTSFLILVMSAVGGCWWPLEITPPFMQKLAYFTTLNAWAMSGFKDVLWYGRGVAALGPEIAALLAISAVAFGVGWWRFRFE